MEPSSWCGCHLPPLNILLRPIKIKLIFNIKEKEGENEARRAGSLSSAAHRELGKG